MRGPSATTLPLTLIIGPRKPAHDRKNMNNSRTCQRFIRVNVLLLTLLILFSRYWVLVVSCAEPNGPVPKPLCPAERLICKFTSIAVEGHTFDTNSGARWI